MFEVTKELTNGERLWFALVVGFVAFGIAAMISINPLLSLATMKLLFLFALPVYPIGFIVGWRCASTINKWMSQT